MDTGNVYLYIDCREGSVSPPVQGLESRRFDTVNERKAEFATSRAGADGSFTAVMNDLGDYDPEMIVERIRSGGKVCSDYDSLVSMARATVDDFLCVTDSWGIQNHYWFMDDDVFICSNNLLLVARAIEADLSKTAFFEYLFFLSPLGERTWFDNIRTLRPGQSLVYDRVSRKLETGPYFDPVDELFDRDPSSRTIEEASDAFFSRAVNVLSGRRAALLLSAGSDSRTVLSALRKSGLPITAYSFGTPDLRATVEIEALVSMLGLDWDLVDISPLAGGWEERFRSSCLLTSGYLNPLRVHYDLLYERIPREHAVFEGIFGSQSIKGEFCEGSTVGRCYAEVIRRGNTVEGAVKKHCPGISPDLAGRMVEYISDTYGRDMIDTDTGAGMRNFYSLAFSMVPGRIFSGMMLLGASEHDTYYPFLSFDLLRSVYSRGLGARRSLSIRSDFPGPVAALVPESIIVRSMDREIYRSVLDRGVSFREALEYPMKLSEAIRKARNLIRKIRFRGYFAGQVDNTAIHVKMASYIRRARSVHPLIDGIADEPGLSKQAANTGMILEIVEGSRPPDRL